MSDSSADADRAHRYVQLAWITIAIYLLALGISAVLRTQGDFNLYYRAGARVLQGETIYRLDEKSHFLYAPIFAIAFAPFAALPLHAAQFAWYLVCAASLLALIFGSMRMLFGPHQQPGAELLVVPLFLCAPYVNNNIEHGQINLPTLALLVWSIVFAEEDRAIVAGLALAGAILIKPFAVLAALFLVLEGKWRPIASSIGFGVALLILPFVVFGPSNALAETRSYFQVVTSMTDRYTLMLTNQSATSAVARLMSLDGPSTSPSNLALPLGTIIELALIAMVVIWMVRDRDHEPAAKPYRFQLAALFCIMPSLVPISWKSYYVALLVPYLLLTAVLWTRRPRQSSAPVAALALVAVSAILNWNVGSSRLSHAALFFSAPLLSSLVLMVAIVIAASWWRISAQCRHTLTRTVNS